MPRLLLNVAAMHSQILGLYAKAFRLFHVVTVGAVMEIIAALLFIAGVV
jgi:hypothetical protein